VPESYMIVFEGKTQEGRDPAEVKNRLAELLRIQPTEASSLFSGVRLVLWRNLDLQSATALKAAVEKTGADCRVRRARTNGEGSSAAKPEPLSPPEQSAPVEGNPAGDPTSAAPPLPPPVKQEPAEASQAAAKQSQSTPPQAGCPKCGYVARDARDELLTLGQCPACGLVLAKYHPIEPMISAPVAQVAEESPGSPTAAGKQEIPDEPAWEEGTEAWDELEQAGDWQVFSRGTAILSLIVGFGLTILPPWQLIESRPLRGLVFGILVVLVSCIAYQCYLFYLRKRGSFLPYVLLSLGTLAVLAGLGGLLYRVYAGIGMFFSATDWRQSVTFARTGLFLSTIYLCAAIFLAYSDQARTLETPNETRRQPVRVVTQPGNVDGQRYSQAVQEAKATFGRQFPKAERPRQYLYFKNVYVRSVSSSGLKFSEMVNSLIPSFEVSDFHTVLDSEVELLMFNAIGFRGELAVEGIIPDEMERRLEALAWAWAEPTGVESRPLSYAERVALFDSKCPMDSPAYLGP